MKTLGPRLREIREARGLSQRELAELVGVDVMQVNRYERGMHLPSLETVLKLTRVFQLTMDELLLATGTLKTPEIRNVKLFQRFRVLDSLPKQDQDVVLELVDAVIARRRMQAALGPVEEMPPSP